MEQQFKDAKWVAETFDLPLQRVYELTRREVIPQFAFCGNTRTTPMRWRNGQTGRYR
jgi:hypothetical protein